MILHYSEKWQGDNKEPPDKSCEVSMSQLFMMFWLTPAPDSQQQ